MDVMPGDAAAGNLLQLGVGRRGVDDQRRVELFEDVAVLLQQQAKELLHIMCHQVEFDGILARYLDRFRSSVEADQFAHGQNVDAAQVVIRVGGGKAIQV